MTASPSWSPPKKSKLPKEYCLFQPTPGDRGPTLQSLWESWRQTHKGQFANPGGFHMNQSPFLSPFSSFKTPSYLCTNWGCAQFTLDSLAYYNSYNWKPILTILTSVQLLSFRSSSSLVSTSKQADWYVWVLSPLAATGSPYHTRQPSPQPRPPIL